MTHARLVRTVAALAVAAGAALPALASTWTYSASLTGAGESPPVTTTAFGSALVTFNDVALTVAVTTSFTGLTGGPASAAHIHCCTATPNAGTAPVYQGFTSFPNTISGTYANTFTLTSASFSQLLAGTQAGEAYVNIHNAAYPAGEIQGFLVAVPEPGIYALMLLGLGGLGVAARRRLTSASAGA